MGRVQAFTMSFLTYAAIAGIGFLAMQAGKSSSAGTGPSRPGGSNQNSGFYNEDEEVEDKPTIDAEVISPNFLVYTPDPPIETGSERIFGDLWNHQLPKGDLVLVGFPFDETDESFDLMVDILLPFAEAHPDVLFVAYFTKWSGYPYVNVRSVRYNAYNNSRTYITKNASLQSYGVDPEGTIDHVIEQIAALL